MSPPHDIMIFNQKVVDGWGLSRSNYTLENTTVSCRVTIDGVLFKETTSEEALKFVDYSGLIPFPTPTVKTP